MSIKTIYKYELTLKDRQCIEMPEDWSFLTIQTQNNEPVLWAMVNPDIRRKKTTVFIEMFGTGNPIPEKDTRNLVYLATIQMGILVWHFFERIT